MSSFVKQKARYQQYNQGSTDCRDSRGRSIEVKSSVVHPSSSGLFEQFDDP